MREWLARRAQFLVFVSGGVLCAVLDIGVMQLLIGAGVAYPLATTAGFATGLLINYAFHARLTFKARATPFNFLRFLCVVAVNYVLTMACVALAVTLLGDPAPQSALIGKLVSLPLVAVNGFLLSKYWIFK